MDEAKEVHTSLRTAAGIFKFVKVKVGFMAVPRPLTKRGKSCKCARCKLLGGGAVGVLVHPPPEKFGIINKLWSTIFGIFHEYFFKKVNLVQLGIIFPSEYILFSILSNNLCKASACCCLLLALAVCYLYLRQLNLFFI